MKQDPPYFEGKEPALIYIAKKLNDALRLDSIFEEDFVYFFVLSDE